MLMYSELFGLRDIPGSARVTTPGVYVREPGGWVVSSFDKRIRYGLPFNWISVHRDQLPARLKLEALIQGVVL